MTIKLNCAHADTCLPDYWSGHHLPHVQIPVDKRMTISQVRDAIRNEIRQGAVAGNTDDARLLSGDDVRPGEEKRADALTRAAYAAINRDVKMRKPGKRYPFADLDDTGDDYDDVLVYAFFVFIEAEIKPLNYDHFYGEGIKSARMGNTRTPGNEYRMPVFGAGKSWQAKAFAEGFHSECRYQGKTVLSGE